MENPEFKDSLEGLSLQELEAMREEMDKALQEIERQERQDALKQVQALVKQHNFLAFEIYSSQEKTKAKVPDKYYDPDTGQRWSGRGKPPRWIQGKDREQFLIRPQPTLDPQEAKETGLIGAMTNAGIIKN